MPGETIIKSIAGMAALFAIVSGAFAVTGETQALWAALGGIVGAAIIQN